MDEQEQLQREVAALAAKLLRHGSRADQTTALGQFVGEAANALLDLVDALAAEAKRCEGREA